MKNFGATTSTLIADAPYLALIRDATESGYKIVLGRFSFPSTTGIGQIHEIPIGIIRLFARSYNRKYDED
jgi:hypothetical protein